MSTTRQVIKHKISATHNTDTAADSAVTHGPIIEDAANIRKDPYTLPQGFSWDTLDLSSPTVVNPSSDSVFH